MKILQINTVVNSGSTGRIAEEIGKLILEQRHESYIAYALGSRPSDSRLIKIGGKYDFLIHGLVSSLNDGHGLASKKATKELINRIEEIKPDAIGLHNIHGYYLNYPVLFNYLKKRQYPVLWTFHDCWPFTGHCSYFEKTGCEKWKTSCNTCPQIKHYPMSLVDRSNRNYRLKRETFLGLNNLTIITPSQWLKNLVDKSFLQDYHVKVIHNGVDLEVFKPKISPHKVKNYSIVLGVASNWDERKGLSDFKRLREYLPKEIRIVLIGVNKKQLKQLPLGIQGIERTENLEELVRWYNDADVFVNPTYVDNFPTTNIEALACGTPVITYETGGSPEAINESTGRVVKKGDITGMAREINHFIEFDKNKLREECRSRALLKFDKNARFDDYINIYESLIKNK